MWRLSVPWLFISIITFTAAANEIEEADSALMRGEYGAAIKMFADRSDHGDAVAMVRLASLYHRGEGVERDVEKAMDLYLSAAEMGNAEAQFNLGNMYLLGEGVAEDEAWALTFYRLASKQGHQLATANMREIIRANTSAASEPHEAEATQADHNDNLDATVDTDVSAMDTSPGEPPDPSINATPAALLLVDKDLPPTVTADALSTTQKSDEISRQSPVPTQSELHDNSAATAGSSTALSPTLPDTEIVAKLEGEDDIVVVEHSIVTLEAVDTLQETTVQRYSSDEVDALQFAEDHGIDVKLVAELPSGQVRQITSPKLQADAELAADQTENRARFETAQRQLAQQQFSEGIAVLTELAQNGYADAALFLAGLAERGEGRQWDVGEATKWRLSAANLGNSEAQYQIAAQYMGGQGVDQDEAMAITFYRDAARSGHALAKQKLAEIYAEAGLPMPDFTRPREPTENYENKQSIDAAADGADVGAVKVGEQAAATLLVNDDNAMPQPSDAPILLTHVTTPTIIVTHPPSYLALRTDALVSLDPAKPINYEVVLGSVLTVTRVESRQAIDSLDGDPIPSEQTEIAIPADAEEETLAEHPLIEREVPALVQADSIASLGEHDDAALSENVELAESENSLALAIEADRVSPIFDTGDSEGESGTVNTPATVVDIDQSVVSGTIDDAKRSLADGRYAEAKKLFTSLAEQGGADAQAHLGYMYSKGEGVETDMRLAIDWYRRAAVLGNRDAQYNLAVAYAFGEGVMQDDGEAVIWYRRAAEQGSAVAQYSLGVSYALGEGVLRDDVAAIKWYRVAAEQGYAAAQYSLGYGYRSGHGIEVDDTKALRWFLAAATSGHASAPVKRH